MVPRLLSILAAAAGKIGMALYQQNSKANISRQLIQEKHDYAAALRLELKAGDYAAIDKIVQAMPFPASLRTELVPTASELCKVCHLVKDPRNSYIPATFKSEILTSAHQTYERLFQLVQKVTLLEESHFSAGGRSELVEGIAGEIRSIHVILAKCLDQMAGIILQVPGSTSSIASMEMVLCALQDADRMLAGV